MKFIKFFVIIFLLVVLSGCANKPQNNTSSDDIKYACETFTDCVDGSYCEYLDDGCVNYDWWRQNLSQKFKCEPDPSKCLCENNRCVKK